MTKVLSGTVKAVARNGKGIMLEQRDGEWFNAYSPAQIDQSVVMRGAQVSFKYEEKVSGGREYLNIRGSVKVDNPGTGASLEARSHEVEPRAIEFGKTTLHRDRSIARQNACNVIVNLIGPISPLTEEDIIKNAHLVVAGAQIIEAYTTGDLDKAVAEARKSAAASMTVAGGDLPAPVSNTDDYFDEEMEV